jgi:hypothetical protein
MKIKGDAQTIDERARCLLRVPKKNGRSDAFALLPVNGAVIDIEIEGSGGKVVRDIRKPKVDRPLAVAYSPQLSLFKIVRLGRRI